MGGGARGCLGGLGPRLLPLPTPLQASKATRRPRSAVRRPMLGHVWSSPTIQGPKLRRCCGPVASSPKVGGAAW
jgi:hypothetical protein